MTGLVMGSPCAKNQMLGPKCREDNLRQGKVKEILMKSARNQVLGARTCNGP